MLTINGRKFMNIEEAVQWLLENNALPFQCKADYAADTIISMSEIINPSPAEIKVGAIVYFHDCNIATVTGITSNGFTVGSDHIDMSEGLFDGDITIGGDLNVDGDAKVFENIVDKDGHKRFIEGDITMETIGGVTQSYGKWSLSGSHLMVVLSFETSGATLSGSTTLAEIEIPKWIFDKITPISTFVDLKVVPSYGGNDIDYIVVLSKTAQDTLVISTGGATYSFGVGNKSRIQFDLLIDNE